MNEISIIIDGVRYDAVKAEELYSCKGCVFQKRNKMCVFVKFCAHNRDIIFKKSNKKFEP